MKKSSRMTTARRDTFQPITIASPLPRLQSTFIELAPIEDRRYYDPTRRIKPPGAIRRSAARVVSKNQDRFGKSVRAQPFRQRFAIPQQVAICIRRRRRKEVIFALNKAGRKGRKMKRPRRNFWSDVSC